MVKLAIALAALAACTVDRIVLDGAITDCTTALEGVNGQACNFDTGCSSATECCDNSAYCRDGALVVEHNCNADCAICIDDTQCTYGSALCNSNRCQPCEVCPATVCPPGWEHLVRNGCVTCDCAPVSTCDVVDATCPNGTCYRGAVCSTGCPSTDPTCCSNQCEPVGCTAPVPTGCLMTCPPPLTSVCPTCAADSCTCNGGQWICNPICALGAHASCVAP